MDRLGEKPYIGVTGISNAREARAIVQTFISEGLTNEQSSHRGMIGILASERTLNPQSREGAQHPNLDSIRQIFSVTVGRAFNTLHYHTNHEGNLAGQLDRLVGKSGLYADSLCEGIQLNIKWPPVSEVEKIKNAFPDVKIILQLGPRVLTESPEDIASNLAPYVGLIDYALIDPSGGKNKIFAVNTVAPVHNQIRAAYPDLSLVFAGGFDARNVRRRLWLLLQTVGTTNFGVDAQGGLRMQSRQELPTPAPMSINRARGYIRNAALSFRVMRGEDILRSAT